MGEIRGKKSARHLRALWRVPYIARLLARPPRLPVKEDALPLDPRLEKGNLPCGMRYLTLANRKPKGICVLRLVVRAGSLLEDEDQLGVAHLLEHVLFRGIPSFPNVDALMKYFTKCGMSWGADLNAQTEQESTTFILVVPVNDGDLSLLEKGLRVLREFAFEALLRSEDIAAEKAVVEEEWRVNLGADQRVRECFMSKVFGQCRHGCRLPIGKMDVLRACSDERVRAFYDTWYRPENMALICAGDFPCNATIRKMLNQIFAESEPKKLQKSRPLQQFQMLATPRVSLIHRDPELTTTLVRLRVYVSDQPINSVNAVLEEVSKALVVMAFNRRLTVIQMRPHAPFMVASVEEEEHSSTYQSVALVGVTRVAKVQQTTVALVAEAARIARWGVSAAELELARANYLAALDSAWIERHESETEDVAEAMDEHFQSGEQSRLANEALENRVQRAAANSITVDSLKGIAASMFNLKDGNWTLQVEIAGGQEEGSVTQKNEVANGKDGSSDEEQAEDMDDEEEFGDGEDEDMDDPIMVPETSSTASTAHADHQGDKDGEEVVPDSNITLNSKVRKVTELETEATKYQEDVLTITEVELRGIVEETAACDHAEFTSDAGGAEAPPQWAGGDGQVTKEEYWADFDLHHWELSNGSTVTWKNTDFEADQIILHGIAPGGKTELKDAELVGSGVLGPMRVLSGLGGLTRVQLVDFLAGKNAAASFAVDTYSRRLVGHSGAQPAEFEIVLQLTAAHFETPRFDSSGLDRVLEIFKERIANQERDPDHHFTQKIRELTCGDHEMFQDLTIADVANLTKLGHEGLRQLYMRCFSQPAEWSWIIVGSLPDPGTLRDLVAKHLASIKTERDSGTPLLQWHPLGQVTPVIPSFAPGISHADVFRGLAETASVYMCLPANRSILVTAEQRLAASCACEILETRLLACLRTAMRMSYSVSCGMLTSGAPQLVDADRRTTISVQFSCEPAAVTKCIEEVLREVAELRTSQRSVSEEEAVTCKAQFKQRLLTSKRENTWWLGRIAACLWRARCHGEEDGTMQGTGLERAASTQAEYILRALKHIIENLDSRYDGINSASAQEVASGLFLEGQRATVVLLPEVLGDKKGSKRQRTKF